MKSSYTQDEANILLQMAIERETLHKDVSHDQLLTIASEIGLSEMSLKAAEEEWLSEDREQMDRAAFRRAQLSSLQGRLWFCGHLAMWMFATLALIDDLDHSSGPPFAIIPIICWGLAVLFHGLHVFTGSGRAGERAFRKWQLARRMMKAEALGSRYNSLREP